MMKEDSGPAVDGKLRNQCNYSYPTDLVIVHGLWDFFEVTSGSRFTHEWS